MDAQNIVALDHLKAALPGLAAQARERERGRRDRGGPAIAP